MSNEVISCAEKLMSNHGEYQIAVLQNNKGISIWTTDEQRRGLSIDAAKVTVGEIVAIEGLPQSMLLFWGEVMDYLNTLKQ